MTVGILIVIIAAAVILASFGVGALYIWAGAENGWWSAFWMGLGTLLMIGCAIGIVGILVHLIVASWHVPL